MGMMLRRLAPLLIAAAVALISMAALAPQAATGAPARNVDYVIIAGVPGLRWEDVGPATTPTLWRMAERGSIGSLSVRSARQPTCPVDGWVTLGAGNYAAGSRDATTPTSCPPLNAEISRSDRIGAYLPDQRALVVHNKERLPWGAVPGALTESVRCTTAVGKGAAVAAARPFGRVDRYEPALPGNAHDLLASCVLSIVDLGTVAGDDAGVRAAAARRADAELARVLAARPENSLVLVAGVADTDRSSRLHVAVADGPGWERGWLTSASTGRDGYLQLVDLAPTVLAALGRPAPHRLFAGHSASSVPGRPADLRAAVTQPADADREAGAQRQVTAGFFAALAGFQILLYAAVVPLLRRARRLAGTGDPAVPGRLVAGVQVLLVAAALAIPAALVGDAVPWWRTGRPALVFVGVALGVLALATATVGLTRPYRRTLGPLGLVAGLAAVAVAADVVTGARLQLNGVAGYSALEGGRYAGLGTVGLGVFIAGALLTAGFLAQQVRRAWRPVVVVFVGGIAVVLVGSPYLGADAGGAVALTAGVCITAALCTGGWLTFARLAWATLAGLAVTVGFAALDLLRPPEQRGGLGRFLGQLSEGTGGLTVHRTGVANVVAFATSPLTGLALTAAVFVWFALLRPWGGLKRLFGLYPAVRAAMVGIAVATVIAGVLGGAALNVAGAASAIAVPLAALAAWRVLDHATDRTFAPMAPAGPVTGDTGPPAVVPHAGGPDDVLPWRPVDRAI
jgi:hypothetical protein